MKLTSLKSDFKIQHLESVTHSILKSVFEQNYPVLVDNVAYRRYELLNDNYSTRHGITSYEFLDRDVPNISKRTQAIVIVLGYPLSLYSNTLFVKDTVLFGFRTWRNPSQTEQKTSSHLGSFHSARGYNIQALIRIRSKVSMILFSSRPYMLNMELQAMCIVFFHLTPHMFLVQWYIARAKEGI